MGEDSREMTDNMAVDRIYCGDMTDLTRPVAPIIRSVIREAVKIEKKV